MIVEMSKTRKPNAGKFAPEHVQIPMDKTGQNGPV